MYWPASPVGGGMGMKFEENHSVQDKKYESEQVTRD